MGVDVKVDLDLTPLQEARKGYKVALRKGVARAAKPVRQAVIGEAAAVKRYGFLSKATGTKVAVYKAGESVVAAVGAKMSVKRTKGKYTRGPRKGEKKVHIPYLYSWLVNKGTRRSRATRYLDRAFAAAGESYPERLRAELEKVTAELLAARG